MVTAKDEYTESRQYDELSQQNRRWKKQQIPSRRRCPRRPHDDGGYTGAGRYVSDGHETKWELPCRRTNQHSETDHGTEKRRPVVRP